MNADTIRSVLKEVDEKELVDMAKSLITHDSFTGHEQPIAEFLVGYARKQGLNCRIVKAASARPNVLLSLTGVREFRFLMNGHVDIDPVVDGWSVDPFRGVVKEGWLYGAGIVNMKAADAAMIEALLAIRRSKLRAGLSVGVSLVCGELQGGFGTIKLLEQGLRAKHAVVGEPTRLSVETYHYGIRRLLVLIKGKAAHLAYAEAGRNAVLAASQAILSLNELGLAAGSLDSKTRNPVVNIGAVRGGVSHRFEDWRPAILPDTCVITLDVRLPRDEDEAEVLSLLQSRISQALPMGFDLELKLLKPPEHYPRPSFQAAESSATVEALKKIHERVVGTPPTVGDLGRISLFGSDAPYLKNAGVDAVVYGPGDPALMNTPDERIQISEMVTAAKVYAALAVELGAS